MLRFIRYGLGRALLPIAERLNYDSWVNLPRPAESRLVVHAAGARADRVLLAGNSLSVGWGVVSHDLALAGQLARGTAAITGRGVDVDVHARPDKTTRMVERFLTPESLVRYDAIVLGLGTREAFQGIPLALWLRQMNRLFDHIAHNASPRPPIVVAAADEITQVPIPAGPARRAIAHVRTLNRATRALVESREGVVFAESAVISPSGTGQEFFEMDKVRLYETAASPIASVLASVLGGGGADNDVLDENGRLAAIEHVRDQLAVPPAEVERLVALARDLFGATDAVLLLVGTDSILPIVADTSIAPVPPEQSFSHCAIRQRHGFVVSDLRADPRFRDRPDVIGPPFRRAYAGHRVESPEGHPVAVLGLAFSQTREFSPADLALLRALAHRAGELLFHVKKR